MNTKSIAYRNSLTEQSCSTSGVNNPTEFLLAEDGPGGVGAGVCTLDVYVLYLVPFFISHVPETNRHT